MSLYLNYNMYLNYNNKKLLKNSFLLEIRHVNFKSFLNKTV